MKIPIKILNISWMNPTVYIKMQHDLMKLAVLKNYQN